MRRWLSLLLLAALGVTPAFAAGREGLPLASEASVTAAAQSCIGLSSDLDADRHLLDGRGWKKGTLSANGKPVEDASAQKLEFYGRDGMLLLLNVDDKPSCMILAKSAIPEDRLEALAIAALGRPVSDREGSLMWILKTRQSILFRSVPEADHRLLTFFFTATGQKS